MFIFIDSFLLVTASPAHATPSHLTADSIKSQIPTNFAFQLNPNPLFVPKFISKLEDHHNPHHDSEAAIQEFLSGIPTHLNDLILRFDSDKPTSEILSFPWIKLCFGFLRVQHRAFSKLLLELDHPLKDQFLKHTLKLLDLLNSITSCIAHLGHARLSLSHALTLLEANPSSAIDRLKPIGSSRFRIEEGETEVVKSGKEWGVCRGLMVMEQIGLWVCGVVISGLSGDVGAFTEMRKMSGEFGVPELERLDFAVHEGVCESGVRLKEVKRVNDAVEVLVASMAAGETSEAAAEDLQKRLEVLEKEMDDLRKEVDSFFSDLLDERSKLLDCLRQTLQ